jgi:hypothetical protein
VVLGPLMCMHQLNGSEQAPVCIQQVLGPQADGIVGSTWRRHRLEQGSPDCTTHAPSGGGALQACRTYEQLCSTRVANSAANTTAHLQTGCPHTGTRGCTSSWLQLGWLHWKSAVVGVYMPAAPGVAAWLAGSNGTASGIRSSTSAACTPHAASCRQQHPLISRRLHGLCGHSPGV